MSKSTRLQYDEITQITKKLQDEGEQVAQLQTSTRQKLDALRTEWVGTAAGHPTVGECWFAVVQPVRLHPGVS